MGELHKLSFFSIITLLVGFIMSLIEVYYHQGEQGNIVNSPIQREELGFDIDTVFKNSSTELTYHQCPAWNHKSKRTFIVRSPIDISLSISSDGRIGSNLEEHKFDRWVGPTFRQPNWHTDNHTTFQLTIPSILFWTKNKNVWVEQRPHPYTSTKNNFVCINGWWNLSQWTRPVDFAFDVVDNSKPVVINRGDPLYLINFYGKDLNDNVKLIKKIPSEDLINKYRMNISIKDYVKFLSSKYMFKNKESKCPFDFLWKK
jgi:hypothetical protein